MQKKAYAGMNIIRCPYCKGTAFIPLTLEALAEIRTYNLKREFETHCHEKKHYFGVVLYA